MAQKNKYLRKLIMNFKPLNEQEKKDKEKMINCIDIYPDILYRSNKKYHFTVSGLVLNEEKNETLLVEHKIYKSLWYPGGHAGGKNKLPRVIIKEVKEETGIKNVKLITGEIVSIEVLPVKKHIYKGEIVSEHEHLNVTYLLQTSKEEEKNNLRILPSENTAVKWVHLNDLLKVITEEYMVNVYKKLLERI